MVEIEKLDLKSMDIVEEKREQLKVLFPEAFTEGQKIDFERLKLTLGEMVDPGKERYGMNWPGKADCFKIIQQPSIATLTPARDESIDFDTTENLFIEGDNLEVLKLLQKSYFGKVKMIYIDPPYNTGNDFIYPDDYSESLDTYLRYTGQIDNEGRKYSTNTETDGRFHSKWMNMMYPRLFLSRNLLREDGVIFITIDDAEVHNLRALLNEVFGEENFVTSVTWQKKVSPSNDAKWFSSDHDQILIYSKNKELWRPIRQPLNEKQKSYYQNPDNDPRGPWNSSTYTCNKTKDERPNLYYPIINPNTKEEIWPSETAVWAYSKRLHDEHMVAGLLYWGKDGNATKPRFKKFLIEAKPVVPRTVWPYSEVGHTQVATQVLNELMPEVKFETPKPPALINKMLQIATQNESSDIILDFFAGSGTTAQAILEMNFLHNGNRKFILVQLPEPTGREVFCTIADIGKERIRRVIKRIKEEQEKKKDMFSGEKPVPDLGFKVFKLQPSNFKLWDGDVAKDEESIKKQIELFVEHINPQSSQEDILYEILLKSGFPLTTKIEKSVVAEKDVFSIDDGSMLICLEKDLTSDVIKEMAEMKPVRVVCIDEGFKGNDQLKTNAVQIMKTRNITFRTI